jgi:hypothetical protein
MAKKVAGYIADNSELWLEKNFNGGVIFRKTKGIGEMAATLVFHNDDHERVFTESEVRSIVNKAIRSQSDPGAFVVRLARAADNESVAGWKRRALQYVLNALDPA